MIRKNLWLFSILIVCIALRFWQLGENPPALYWDEASLGYNAYSISQSLRDEHGEFLPLARFIAFGDFKPPGYIYAAVPVIKILGLNEFAVRFPSALAGVLLVLLTYLLARQLFSDFGDSFALLSTAFIAISPWALQFSRGAFEANLAALFNALGVLFFLWFVNKGKGYSLLLSTIAFVFSFYTFNANRIIAPLLQVGLSIIFYRKVLQQKKWLVISIIVGFLLLYPSFSYLANRESRLRFQEVSIFNDLEVIRTANQRIEKDDFSLFAKIIHNRRLAFAQDFLKHYFDNFDFRYLFISGDVNPRLSIQEVGELYLFDLPFLLIGLYSLIKRRDMATLVIFCWWFMVPIPAATAKETPHALRTVSLLPLPQIVAALGLWTVYQWVKQRQWVKKVFIAGAFLALTVNFFYYLHNYYVHYPRDWSQEWQYGYKEAVGFVSRVEKDYDQVVVTEGLGRPYIYFLFYKKYPPEKFWQERQASRDWWGLWTVSGFGKYKFGVKYLENSSGKTLFVVAPDEVSIKGKILTTINYLNGEPALKIGEKD
jgi:4-amino-4-deoxy-L-arabinose transferase-like glycosyltransferase